MKVPSVGQQFFGKTEGDLAVVAGEHFEILQRI